MTRNVMAAVAVALAWFLIGGAFGPLAGKQQPDPEIAVTKTAIEGEPPSPVLPPAGCRFNPRCPAADDRCRSEEPQLREIGAGHFVACHHPLVGGEAPVTVRTTLH